MAKEDYEDFENSTKYWISGNSYFDDNGVKVTDHCHITGEYRGSADRDCNVNLKLNHKIPVECCNPRIMIPTNLDVNVIQMDQKNI